MTLTCKYHVHAHIQFKTKSKTYELNKSKYIFITRCTTTEKRIRVGLKIRRKTEKMSVLKPTRIQETRKVGCFASDFIQRETPISRRFYIEPTRKWVFRVSSI